MKPQLHRLADCAAKAALLPRRLQRILPHLLQGGSEGEIAYRLGLSPHTVHEYAKHTFRAFGVSGRVELMAGFIDLKALSMEPAESCR